MISLNLTRFVGGFVGIWLAAESTYQQVLEAGYDSLSSSFSSKKQYNSENASGFPLGVSGESSFVLSNKGREFRPRRLACRALDQNNSFFRLLGKTIHL